MQDNLVSIITPSYNSACFISETIESVMNQTYINWEMIIVDDCSTDNSVGIIEEYVKKDARIKLFKLGENSGAAIARNKALENASGRFIAFLDSDDLWMPDKLEKQIKFMLKNEYVFTFTSYQSFSKKHGIKVIRVPRKINYQQYLKNTIIGCLTVILDKKKLGNIEMLDIKTRQDMVLWLSILKKGYDAYGLDKVLSQYRVVSNSISSNKIKMSKNVWNVYRKIEQLSFVKSSWCFVNYIYNAIKKRI